MNWAIRSIIPDVRLVPVRLELPASLDDPCLDRYTVEDILPLVDGRRSVSEILGESLYPKFTVLRTLYGLAQRGVLKVRDSGAEKGPITVLGPITHAIRSLDSRGHRTVLVVSELPTFRNTLALLLRAGGFAVAEAGNPGDAWQALSQHAVDAIVLDVSIETEDGLGQCWLLREVTRAPFIVLAGNTSQQAVRNALNSGARHVLVKPLDGTLLIERLSRLLEEASPRPSGRPEPAPGC